MSAELIAIVSVGAALFVGLGGLILTMGQWLRSDLRDLAGSVSALETRMSAVEQRLAQVVGVLQGVGIWPGAQGEQPTGD